MHKTKNQTRPMPSFNSGEEFLDYLNTRYSKLHKAYEDAFWLSNMGDHRADKRMHNAQAERDSFRSNVLLRSETRALMRKTRGKILARLKLWDHFFSLYQAPAAALRAKQIAAEIESSIAEKKTSRKEGYIDPRTKKFVEASENKMRFIMRTNPDERTRKACYDALEKLPMATLDEFLEVIKLRNEFARALGFSDFYEYKARIDENMSKEELFSVFDKIYEKTKYAFKNIRKLEKRFNEDGRPGLRESWNFSYMMTGDYIKEEDPYFQFEDALSRWGKSFAALGVDFKNGSVTFDLLDRKGKHNNGFCHYPTLVQFKNGRRVPASCNVSSNAVMNQPMAGMRETEVLFHEAGHAADRLNSTQPDVCVNHEYPPSTVSWAETQSMFMDTLFSSIEWRTRYAKDKKGRPYPFELFQRKLISTYVLRPLKMMRIVFVVNFEKEIYECKNLDKKTLIGIARRLSRKYDDFSRDSISILNLPHIYSWESSAYYHGYGLAELGVSMWREYFFKKYGYIVDNPKVGKELSKIWSYASLYPAKKLIKMATGKPLSADSFLRDITMTIDEIVERAKLKIEWLKKVPIYSKAIDLKGKIIMVHGKEKIADNAKSFEDMDRKYRTWLKHYSSRKK